MNIPRWTTYSELIKCILKLNPSKILEIGAGNHLVADILKKMGYFIEVVDNDKTLNPDYVFDVRDEEILKFENKYDLIIASQVLEHIKYQEFLQVISNLSLITKKAIITLPYTNDKAYFFFTHITFPFLKRGYFVHRRFGFKFYFRKKVHKYNQVHHWEIGTRGFPLRKIKKDIKNSGWIIQKAFFNQNNPYHYFFILFSKKYYKKK